MTIRGSGEPARRALIIGCGIAGPVVAMFLRRAGIEAVIYEARPADDESGAFLNLMPNGMDVLKTLGIHDDVVAYGHPSTAIEFLGGAGRPLGAIEMQPSDGGPVTPIVIRRGLLNRALREAAVRSGIEVQYGRKLVAVRDRGSAGVSAVFDDGTEAEGDFLLGCDGIHSRTRQSLFPAARGPEYTGILDSGAIARVPNVPPTGAAMRMYFGRRAFFGYTLPPGGEVYWFSNHHSSREPARGELERVPDDEWKRLLLELHRDDPDPVMRIVRATEASIGRWPIYDLPSLERWHSGRVCLLGDAAHATSPHVGGGASLAMEDAIVVAQCVRDFATPEAAFARFESLRQERVRRLVRDARRTGRQKAVSNPVLARIRDFVLPFFLGHASKANRWVHSYHVDWDASVATAGAAAPARKAPAMPSA